MQADLLSVCPPGEAVSFSGAPHGRRHSTVLWMAGGVERCVDSTTVEIQADEQCHAEGVPDKALPVDKKATMRLHLRLEVRRAECRRGQRTSREMGAGRGLSHLTLALCPLPDSTSRAPSL